MVAGPSPSRPAVLDNVTLSLSAWAVTVTNVIARGGSGCALRAVIGDRLLFDGVIVAGVRHDNRQDGAVVEVSVAPGGEATIEWRDTWLVDNICWSGRPTGLAVQAGEGATYELGLRGSGFVANSLPHEVVVQGARSVTMEDGAIIGPAQPEPWAGAAIVARGAPVVLRATVLAPGGERPPFDTGAQPPEVSDQRTPHHLDAARSLRAQQISSTASVHQVL